MHPLSHRGSSYQSVIKPALLGGIVDLKSIHLTKLLLDIRNDTHFRVLIDLQ